MRKVLASFFTLIFCSIVCAHGTASFAPAVKNALPSVVSISAERKVTEEQMHPFLKDPFFRHFFEENFPQSKERNPHQDLNRALGSGVIMSSKGYIVTNYHVVHHAEKIHVKLHDDREFPATLIGSDPDTDLAVLQISASSLPVADIGEDQKLQIGDIVLAIGNPFGVGQTVTQGIVSAMKRKNLGLNVFESYIQTDAAINPGNSGGPLVDSNGRVVGINTAIISSSGGNNGIGFAVPISFAEQVMNELIEDGHVTRGWLGVYVADLTAEIKESLNFHDEKGALVTGVARRSPAALSGIRPGDIITRIDNEVIESSSDVSNAILKRKPQTKVEIEVLREKDEILFGVVIGERVKKNK